MYGYLFTYCIYVRNYDNSAHFLRPLKPDMKTQGFGWDTKLSLRIADLF